MALAKGFNPLRLENTVEAWAEKSQSVEAVRGTLPRELSVKRTFEGHRKAWKEGFHSEEKGPGEAILIRNTRNLISVLASDVYAFWKCM